VVGAQHMVLLRKATHGQAGGDPPGAAGVEGAGQCCSIFLTHRAPGLLHRQAPGCLSFPSLVGLQPPPQTYLFPSSFLKQNLSGCTHSGTFCHLEKMSGPIGTNRLCPF